MRKISILFIVIGLFLVGCSQKVQPETTVAKSNADMKMEHLNLKETNEIAIFTTAVSDSIKEPGIVNMTNPHYQFNLGKESYLLWITEDNGTIMNSKDTSTIYTLSTRSVKEVNEIVN